MTVFIIMRGWVAMVRQQVSKRYNRHKASFYKTLDIGKDVKELIKFLNKVQEESRY